MNGSHINQANCFLKIPDYTSALLPIVFYTECKFLNMPKGLHDVILSASHHPPSPPQQCASLHCRARVPNYISQIPLQLETSM